MYNLDVEPIHWEPMPIKDHVGWWFYGARSISQLRIEGKDYGLILRIWSQGGSVYSTDKNLEPFHFQWERIYPDHDDQFGPLITGTLEHVLEWAHNDYLDWIRLHGNRLFQLSAFCTALNKLYALNHLGTEDSEDSEGEE